MHELDDPKISLTSDSGVKELPRTGELGQSNTLPIFKLLRVYRLQQYAKILSDLGYGKEVYKLLCLNENQKLNLLNKLNLMPGHRAKFMNFFESIHKAYPQEERKASLQRPSKVDPIGKPQTNL